MKRLILLGFLASMTTSAAFAGEEIQLAAAIGAPAVDKPVVKEEAVQPTYSKPKTATAAAGSGMTTAATIVIGVAVAAVIAGSSSDSTTSHSP